MAAAPIALTAEHSHGNHHKLLRAAWMAILLGVLMQVLIALAVVLAGKGVTWAEFVRDTGQKVTWSTIVCVGVAFGNAVAKSRAAWTGLFGFLAAPAAFAAAKTIQKSIGVALGAVPPEAAAFLLLLGIKAVQYGAFGAAIAWVGKRATAGLPAYLAVGAAAGATFGMAFVGVLYASAAKKPPPPVLVGQIVNEIVFPIGCALVLFAAAKLGPRLSAVGPARS